MRTRTDGSHTSAYDARECTFRLRLEARAAASKSAELKESAHAVARPATSLLSELQREISGAGFIAGTRADTDLKKIQQQFFLRMGRFFVDADRNRRPTALDEVYVFGADGKFEKTLYRDLPKEIKKLVKYNLQVVKACEAYAALPEGNHVLFPDYDPATKKSESDRVNTALWRVDRAMVKGGAPSWALLEGVLPSTALDDPFTGNGAAYVTECAQLRTLIQLKALKDYFVYEHGAGRGEYTFNAMFAATDRDKDVASKYLEVFDAFRAQNRGATWAQFVSAHPSPKVSYALEVSRHEIFGRFEEEIYPWVHSWKFETGPGDLGYFHNYSVSMKGVAVGYVGENTIDLGLEGGVRRYFGHPRGVLDEPSWIQELGQRGIKLHEMFEYLEYFERAHPDVLAEARAWLKPDGVFGSRRQFANWIGTEKFALWHLQATGRPYEGSADIDALSIGDIRGLIEIAMPFVKGRLTRYSEVNRDSLQMLSEQMAELLKAGRLSDAKYGAHRAVRVPALD